MIGIGEVYNKGSLWSWWVEDAIVMTGGWLIANLPKSENRGL